MIKLIMTSLFDIILLVCLPRLVCNFSSDIYDSLTRAFFVLAI